MGNIQGPLAKPKVVHDTVVHGRKAAFKASKQKRNEAIDMRSHIEENVNNWEADDKAKFEMFKKRFNMLSNATRWSTPVAELLKDAKVEEGCVKAECVAWYDANLKAQVRRIVLSVFVGQVVDRFRRNNYGFFMLVDNRGAIVYPPAKVLNAFANCEVDDYLDSHIITKDSKGNWISFNVDYVPELGTEGMFLCFVSGKTTLADWINPADRPFLQGLAKLPDAFRTFLDAKRNSPTEAEIALKTVDSVLTSDLADTLMPKSWNAVVRGGGHAVVNSLSEHLQGSTLRVDYIAWSEINGDKVEGIKKGYEFYTWKEEEEEDETDS